MKCSSTSKDINYSIMNHFVWFFEDKVDSQFDDVPIKNKGML